MCKRIKRKPVHLMTKKQLKRVVWQTGNQEFSPTFIKEAKREMKFRFQRGMNPQFSMLRNASKIKY